MKRLIGLMVLGFSIFMVQSQVASATALKHCGCYPKFDACMKKISPGDSVAGMTACDEAFNTCLGACDSRQACEADCTTARKDGKKTCNEAFKSTTCSIGDAAACTAQAKEDRKACVAALGKKKECKKNCKQS
ncbi:MAG: hypothetical protein AAB425_02965 [Bdellovibrionota bacterium]